jgi:hypothetical protein
MRWRLNPRLASPSTLAIDHVIDHVYAAKDGYRQTSSEGGAGDLSAGEKTLAYFSFEDSKFGGCCTSRTGAKTAAATATGI